MWCIYDYNRGQSSRSMHRASTISNIGWGTITIIVTIRGGESNRKKDHSRLLNSIRISLMATYLCFYCTDYQNIFFSQVATMQQFRDSIILKPKPLKSEINPEHYDSMKSETIMGNYLCNGQFRRRMLKAPHLKSSDLHFLIL